MMMRGSPYEISQKDRDRIERLDPLLIECADNPDPEQILLAKEQTQQIDRALQTLTPREERAIRLYYGLGGCEPHTLDQAGLDLNNVTRERVRQILTKGRRKLRHKSRLGALDHYLRHNYDADWLRREAEEEERKRREQKRIDESKLAHVQWLADRQRAREEWQRQQAEARKPLWREPILYEMAPELLPMHMRPDVIEARRKAALTHSSEDLAAYVAVLSYWLARDQQHRMGDVFRT